MSRRAPLLVALLTLALHLCIASRYGWFRDELYFLACGRRLAWGYVDQPPLIAFISRLAFALSGGHVALYRLPAALGHAGAVYLCGRFAQRLGGGAILACLCAALAPLYAVEGHLLTMNAFEPLLYLAAVAMLARILAGEERLWPAVGAVTGIALLNKHSFALYVGCLVLGLLFTPQRRALVSRGFASAALIAAVIVLPHLLWQLRAGFPMLELLSAQKWKNAPWSLGEFVVQQVLELNPVAMAVAAAGLLLLWRELRAVALAFLFQLILFALLKGKSYYLAAAWMPLFAAGGAALSGRLRVATAVAVGAASAVLLPLVLPILSPAALERYQAALGVSPTQLENKKYGALPQHLADMFGWTELRDAVAEAAGHLQPGERAAVFAQNYGEAAALELFGSAGLPVISGHNNYYLWGVPNDVATLLIVGGRLENHQRFFSECSEAAREKDSPWAMPYERELPVWLCRKPKAPLDSIWPRVKHYE